MENTQFHKVDMKKPTPETSLFYHTNYLCWSRVPLRVPLQNIYLSTLVSALLEVRAADPLSFHQFWSLQHPYCMSRSPRSLWAPHVSISTAVHSCWLTASPLGFPLLYSSLHSGSSCFLCWLLHHLLQGWDAFFYPASQSSITHNNSVLMLSTVAQPTMAQREQMKNFKWYIVWFL